MRATGSDNAQARETWAQNGQQLGGYVGQIMASGGETGSDTTDQVDRSQVVTLPRNEKRRRVLATAGDQYP